MSARIIGPGPRSMTVSRDKDGHREYKITVQVETSSPFDGPAVVLQCPGLARAGSVWAIGNDIDVWAWCRLDADVKPRVSDEPCSIWDVTQTFSTKPLDKEKADDKQVEDPLLEPPKISGSFQKRKEEALRDRFGLPVLSSSFEQLRGSQVEFEKAYPTIKIEKNVALLELNLCTGMIDCVNADLFWGMPPRTVRLANFSWERKFHEKNQMYYTRNFEFEIDWGTWDRDVMDEGHKALRGKWSADGKQWILTKIGGQNPNPHNPLHFDVVQDRNGNPMQVPLDGAGMPADVHVDGKWYAKPDTRTAGSWLIVAFNSVEDSSGTQFVPGSPVFNTAVVGGGDKYKVGDRITLAGGEPEDDRRAVVEVTAVVGPDHDPAHRQARPTEGPVRVVRLVAPGKYTSNPAVPMAQHKTSGTGTGATFSPKFIQQAGYTTGCGHKLIQKYDEADFLLLGIPATLGPTG